MMTPENVHRDVGAYALGVLEPRDAALFEEHLDVCRSCPGELAQLSVVANLLSYVDRDDLVVAERSTCDPRRGEALVGAVRSERRRSRTRRRLVLAACVAVFMGVGGVAVSGQLGAGELPLTPPKLVSVEQLHAVNRATGVEATMRVEPRKWGSQVTLELTNVHGPLKCRLVAVSKANQTEVVSGWTVPPEGYGTQAQPKPVVLFGGTDIPRDQLARFEVRTVDGALLVSVPA